MKESLELKRKKISANIIEAFKAQFNEEPVEFETCWPISCWDYIQTETRSFVVKLKMATGKLEYFKEEL